MIPITLMGPLVAVVADSIDRRKALIYTSVLYMGLAGTMSVLIATKTVQYWEFLAIALMTGLVMTIEQPSRQTVVRLVVPREDLAAAIPVQGMTFNIARSIGPAIGGFVLAALGPAICFAVNAASFMAVLVAAVKIKTNLKSEKQDPQPIKDLIFEGMLYTVRHPGLLTLFIMEGAASFFGLFYMSQMPAIAKSLLGLDAKGLGVCYSAVGLGALVGLFALSTIARRRIKPLMIRIAMTVFAVLMLVLSFIRIPMLAYPVLAGMGACTIAQFNSTNALFQMIAPSRLQGRVLAMHFWAVAGLAPLGTLLFGFFGDKIGLPPTMVVSSILVMGFSIYGWMRASTVVEPLPEEID